MSASLLALREVVVDQGDVRAVDGVSLAVDAGEAVGLVGESGAGKTTAARAALGLVAPTAGTVTFDGRDVATAAGERAVRRRAAMVFQAAGTSLDPRMRAVESVAEPLAIRGVDRTERRRRARDLLDRVGLPDAADRHPGALSGGERQRVAVARALVGDPDLLVADEPTTGLDASVQAGLVELLAALRRERDLALVLVSHDVRAVRATCDRVAVLHAGRVVERGGAAAVLDDPAHPYTEALVEAVPRPDPTAPTPRPLDGRAPDVADPPDGCRFHPRCPAVIEPEDGPEGEAWRAVVQFRAHLARGGTVPGDPAAVRAAFDLPSGAEEAVRAAAAGDRARAVAAVDAAFPSPCTTETPAERAAEGRSVACHLHGPTDS
ncbi:MAG: ABC transporter ATP-binding protein [Halobacteriaceae archaeon]